MRKMKGLLFQLRRVSGRSILILGLLLAGYLLIYSLSGKDYTDNKEKIEMIERSIQSLANQGVCKIPKLPVNSPEIAKFYLKKEEPIDCGSTEEDWVTCELSLCTVKESIVKKNGKVTCDFTDILRKDDFKFEYGSTIRSNNYVLKASDFVRVKCWAENRERWYGTAIGLRLDEKVLQRKNWSKPPTLNVLMLGFDSLSRNAFIRTLPKSYEYLTNQLQADVLEGYNIVGDGTPQALIPLLTGFTELELPETRKRMKNSEYVNVYPMIWKEYEKHGYATSFNEDVPNIGTFSYRLNGFNEQPTDHYMRTYFIATESDLHYYKRLCLGDKPRHQIFLDYTKDFMLRYRSTPRFAFSFHGELSHDSINLIAVADNDITNWLTDVKSTGILNSTILIIMSDHGNRFSEIRDTLQGKQEERLPFFSFVFPDWFKKEFHHQYKNFQKNVHRLTTPFDIHATLRDILFLQQQKPLHKPMKSRAISLFDKIPENRSCAMAYIEPHWCSCLEWVELSDKTSEEVFRAANTVVDFINKYTLGYRDLCHQLTLGEINKGWSAKLTPHKTLLNFKQNKDFDGFMPDLSSDTKIVNEMYQVKIITEPGKAIYEASVTHNLLENEFHVKLSDISRVNKYGNQARCIYEKNPELRKYCYCK